MGLDLSAIFEGFDVVGLLTALVQLVMDLVGGLIG
jgi:hypothetical protein